MKNAEKNATDSSGAAADPDTAGADGEPSTREDEEEELLTPKNKTLKLEEAQEQVEGGAPVAGSVAAVPEDQGKGVKTLRRPRQKQRRLGKRGAAGPLQVRVGSQVFSGQRLKAYGLNPKRLHGRQVFQQAQRSQERRRRRKKTSKD